METNTLNNENRNELFEELKGKCKSIVKRDLYGSIVLILVIPLLFFTLQKLGDPKNIIYFMLWITIFCFGVWSLLYDYRSLKNLGSLDTPERLLHWFEKVHRYRMITWFVGGICIFGIMLVGAGFNIGAIMGVALAIGIIALLFYYSDGPWWYRKDMDIIEQLRELVEKN
jgi:Na+/melibiose symporter-like transporter